MSREPGFVIRRDVVSQLLERRSQVRRRWGSRAMQEAGDPPLSVRSARPSTVALVLFRYSPFAILPHARARRGGRADREGRRADGRATTHARAVVRTGRRWDVRAFARVRALMSVGVSFVSYRRATPARHRAAHIEECIGKWGFCAVGRLEPRGPAIRRSRSIRTTEKLNLRASRGA